MTNDNKPKVDPEEQTEEVREKQPPAKVEDRVDELDRQDALGKTFGQDADERTTKLILAERSKTSKDSSVKETFGDVAVTDGNSSGSEVAQILRGKLDVARQRYAATQPAAQEKSELVGAPVPFSDARPTPQPQPFVPVGDANQPPQPGGPFQQPGGPFQPGMQPGQFNPNQGFGQPAFPGLGMPGDPNAWKQFEPWWRPANLPPTATEFDIQRARADAMWQTESNWNWDADPRNQPPSLQTAREVLGNQLGGGLGVRPEGLDPKHDICNFYARRFLMAKDANDPQAAADVLGRLEMEDKSGKNPFAGETSRRLNYVDAVIDLKNAKNDAERMAALTRIAKLEEKFGGKEFDLDKLPQSITGKKPEDLSNMIAEARLRVRTEAVDAAMKGGDLAQQQKALRGLADLEQKGHPGAKEALDKISAEPDKAIQVKYARAGARGGDEGIVTEAGKPMGGILDGERDGRKANIRELEVARATMKGPADSFDKSLDWLKALESASDLLHTLNKPEEAQKHLTALLEQKAKGNERATEVLKALNIQNEAEAKKFVDDLKDPQKKYDTIAKVAQDLRQFETQYINMRTFQHSTGKKPEDILREFPDQKLVAKARENAEKFARENYTQADNALGAFLDRKATPKQREEAIAALEKANNDRTKQLGRSNFSGPLDWAKTTDAALKMLEDGKKPDEVLKELRRMADGQNSPEAKRLLLELQNVKTDDPKAFQQALRDSVGKGMDSYRVIRITRELGEKSTPEQWEKARKGLEEEVKAGNKVAGDWKNWAVSQEAVSKIALADKDPERAKAAMKDLSEAAKDNPYARAALASTLLANSPDSVRRDWRELSGGGGFKDKPMSLPDLRELAAKNPELLRTLQKDAITALDATVGKDKPNGAFTREESLAMAMHFAQVSKEAAAGDKNAQEQQQLLDKFFEKQMSEKIPSTTMPPPWEQPSPGSKAAMEGIHAAMAVQAPGAENLADLYLKHADHPAFTTSPFVGNATIGDTASLRLLSGLAAGQGSRRNQEEAASALERAGADPRNRAVVMDEMVRAFDKYKDNYALLSTLGKVAANDANIPDNVRQTMHKALTDSNSTTRASAMEGLFAYAPHWNKADLDAVRKNMTPEMVSALGKHADRIPEELRNTLLKEAAAKLDSNTASERIIGLQTISALAKYATEDQVLKVAQFGEAKGQEITDPKYKDAIGKEGLKEKFGEKDAEAIQKEAGKTILRLLGAQNSFASEAAFNAVGLLKWPELENKDIRQSVLDYVKGKPMSLERMDQIHALVYEANIPPPAAQILRHWRPGLTDQDYYHRAQQIGKNYGTEGQSGDAFIRQMADRVAMWNALAPEQRKQLAGTDAQLNPADIEGMLYNKTLDKNYPWLLDKGIDKKFEDMVSKARAESTAAEADCRLQMADRKATLDALCKQTSKGAGWERLASYSMYAMGLPGLALRSVVGDPLEEFDRKQTELVTNLGAGDEKVAAAVKRQQDAEKQKQPIEFADDVRRYETSVNWGCRKSADFQAVAMLEKYGVDVMRAFGSKPLRDLTERSGQGQFGRSGLERLHDNKFASDLKFQKYDDDPNSGKRFGQGLEALKAIPKDAKGADIEMHRTNALRAIESDPQLNKLADFAREVNLQLGTLQQLHKAATEGTKYEALVQDIKRRAEILDEALKKVTPDQVQAVKERVKEMEAALPSIQDEKAKKDVEQKIESMKQLLKMVDPSSPPQEGGKNGRQQLEELFKSIKSRDFNADTFGNWLKENGPIIAAAVAAAAITVASMGSAAPLAVILVTSATMLVATQVTKEALYLANHYAGDTGLGKYDERSLPGAYVAKYGERWVNLFKELGTKDPAASAAEYMKLSEAWDKEVRNPLLKEYAMNVLMGLVTMGVGNIGAQGLKGAAPKEIWKTLMGKEASQLATSMAEIQALAKGNPALSKAILGWTGRVGKEGANGLVFVGAQEGIHGSLEQVNKAIGRQNHYASFLIAAGLAFVHSKYSAGDPMRGFKGNEVHVDARFVEPLVKACMDKGHTVTKMPNGTFEVRTPTMVAGDPPIIVRATPPVAIKSPHELPAEQRQAPTKASELPPSDAAWLRTGGQQLREGKYREAYETASNNPATKDLPVERVEVKLNASDLPGGLRDHVQKIKDAGRVEVTPEGKITIKEASTVVKLKSGAEVDILKPDYGKMTPGQKAEFETLMKTPEMQRIMAEHAMTKFEEVFHARQFQNDGKVISETYKDYLNQSGETTNDPAMRNDRSKRSLEQEVVCALYDAGFPIEAIQQHYGTQYAGREPVIDYLRQREAGTLGKPAGRPMEAPVGVPVLADQPMALRRTDPLQEVLNKLDPKSADAAVVKRIIDFVEKGAPVNVDAVASMNKDQRGPVNGLLQKRADIDAALLSGDAKKFGGASPQELQKMKSLIDEALQKPATSVEGYAKDLMDLNTALGKVQKLAGPARADALAALERGGTVRGGTKGGWEESTVSHFKDMLKKHPGGPEAVDAMVKAGVSVDMLRNMSAKEIMEGPGALAKQRVELDAAIQGDKLPSHLTKEQAIKMRDSMDALLHADASIPHLKTLKADQMQQVWKSQVEQFNKLAQEVQNPPSGTDPARTQALADILGSVGKVPIALPLEKLSAANGHPTENIQRYRDWVQQLEGYSPGGAAWTVDSVMAKTLAEKHPGLEDWAYVPSQPGSRADTIGIDGVFFNLKTGEARPVDFKEMERTRPVSETGQQQPFEVHTKGTEALTKPESFIKDFLARPEQCGFNTAEFSKVLGPLAKDFPGGIPPLKPEPAINLPEQTARMREYVKKLHEYAATKISSGDGLPSSLYRLGQGAETTLYHLEARAQLAQKVPDLIADATARGAVTKLPDGGLEITLEKPLRVQPDTPRRYSDGYPYDVVKLQIAKDGTVTAIRKDYSGNATTKLGPNDKPVPKTDKEGRPVEEKWNDFVSFEVGKLGDVFGLAKKAAPAKSTAIDAQLRTVQQGLQTPVGGNGGGTIKLGREEVTPEQNTKLDKTDPLTKDWVKDWVEGGQLSGKAREQFFKGTPEQIDAAAQTFPASALRERVFPALERGVIDMADVAKMATHPEKQRLMDYLKKSGATMEPGTFKAMLDLPRNQLNAILGGKVGSDPATVKAIAERANGKTTGNAALDAALPKETVQNLLNGTNAQVSQLRDVADLATKIASGQVKQPMSVIDQLLKLHPDSASTMTTLLKNPKVDAKVAEAALKDVAGVADKFEQYNRACQHNALAITNPTMHGQLLAMKPGPMRDGLIQAGGRSQLTPDQLTKISEAAGTANGAKILDKIFSDTTPGFDKIKAAEKFAESKLPPNEAEVLAKALESGRVKPADVADLVGVKDAALRKQALDLAASGACDSALLGTMLSKPDAASLLNAIKEKLVTADQMQKLLDMEISSNGAERAQSEHIRATMKAAHEGKAKVSGKDFEAFFKDPLRAFDQYLDLDPKYHSKPEMVKAQKDARAAQKVIEQHLNVDQKAALDRFVREEIPEQFSRDFDARLTASRVKDLQWLAKEIPHSTRPAELAKLVDRPLQLAAEASGVRSKLPKEFQNEELVVLLHGTNGPNADRVVGSGGPQATKEWYVTGDAPLGRAYGLEGDNIRLGPAVVAIVVPKSVYQKMIADGHLAHTTPSAKASGQPEPIIQLPDGRLARMSEYLAQPGADPIVIANNTKRLGTEMKFTEEGIGVLKKNGAVFRLDQPKPASR